MVKEMWSNDGKLIKYSTTKSVNTLSKSKNKYPPKVYPSDVVNTKNHWAINTEWNIEGKDYIVTMHEKGFSCTCPAFKKCKHIKQIEEGFE